MHWFFETVRPADLFVTDRFGKKIRPRELFYVLPEHVSQAAKLIQNKILYQYHYDAQVQQIIKGDALTEKPWTALPFNL